jgi:hypothetical protein
MDMFPAFVFYLQIIYTVCAQKANQKDAVFEQAFHFCYDLEKSDSRVLHVTPKNEQKVQQDL